jgi:aspartate-semialdehyde dehydrogenase
MRTYHVAVVGATGMVGRKMVTVLEERNFPVGQLSLLASEHSAGSQIRFKNEQITVKRLTPDAFDGVDIALFSAGGGVSREYAPEAVRRNVVVVDNSSMFRMEKEVPLVVPEVNGEQTFRHTGIIANPNCSTIQLVVTLKPLYDRYGIRRVVVSTYQSVTGAGHKGASQLESEIKGREPDKRAFPYRIAYNAIPHIDIFMDDRSTKEEWKMVQETKKIMNDENIGVAATCVRIPVLGGHSEAVNVELDGEFELEEVRDLLKKSKGITVVDDPSRNQYPMPVMAEDKDDVFVGRIRRDPSVRNGLSMWVVSDNLRKGAATNAVQIAELLINGKS